MMFGLRGASVRYGSTLALSDITIDVPPEQVVTVVGGDGAGKTTLLRALVGMAPLSAGQVRTPGLAEIGYLPAAQGSWLDLTVEENIAFAGSLFGLRGRDLAQRSAELLEASNLGPARDRLSRQLSGGMRRKLGLCLALVHRPALLVLDEPSTGLDPVSRVDLWRLISSAAAAGAAVLSSTTYLDEAERASHVLALDAGRTVVAGPPAEVVSSFDGVITSSVQPVRRQFAWRRGRVFHEVWPSVSAIGTAIEPDLEDVVIALTLGGAR